jgi:hypothetical protein
MAPEAVARGNENHCTALRPIGVETPFPTPDKHP